MKVKYLKIMFGHRTYIGFTDNLDYWGWQTYSWPTGSSLRRISELVKRHNPKVETFDFLNNLIIFKFTFDND